MDEDEQMSEPRVVEIIRKLLAKTTENGCTEEEAASAAAKAAQLMIAHDIQEEALNPKRKNNGYSFRFGRGVLDWQTIVASAVSEVFGSACYIDLQDDEDKMVFFGKGEKPMIAGETWSWITGQMYLVSLRNGIHRAKNPNAFMYGMALTVANRLKDNQKVEPNQTAEPNQTVDGETPAFKSYAIVAANTAKQDMHAEIEGLETKKMEAPKDDVSMLLGIIAGAEVPLEDNKPIEV